MWRCRAFAPRTVRRTCPWEKSRFPMAARSGSAVEMPDLLALCKWLEQTWIAASVRESVWLFPAIETVHLLGMAALVGTITVFDLRLLGWIMRRERGSELARRLLPWT